MGPCQAGTQTCANGAWGSCDGEIAPAIELCNGDDDDCDGTTDNGDNGCGGACPLPGEPESACDGSDDDACPEGTWVCLGINGALCTDQTGDTVEACNAIDDDCDDDVDEGNSPCGGVCPIEVTLAASCDGPDSDACEEGAWVCNASHGAECSDASDDSVESCNDVDDDCDGTTDEGCPDAPQLRFPWNGYTTGSVWATDESLVVKPRRPTFRWEPAAEAVGYEIEIDDSCTLPFADCAFESPEHAASVTTTSYTLTSDLPVSTVPPVGRRYFWRVRACGEAGCTAYSPVRYTDVARQVGDLNGDGYADIVVGAPLFDFNPDDTAGAAYIFFGRAGQLPQQVADVRLVGAMDADAFGSAIAFAGDVDGDGYGDLLVGAGSSNANGIYAAGRAYLYFGAATAAFPTMPTLTFSGTAQNDQLGTSVGSAGDADADGFADFLIGAVFAPEGSAPGQAYLYRGSPKGSVDALSEKVFTGESELANLGGSVTTAGDVNGDGYADFLLGAGGEDSTPGADDNVGRLYVYCGGQSLLSDPCETIDGSVAEVNYGRHVGTAGDIDGDGLSDVLVGGDGDANVAGAIVVLGGDGNAILDSRQTIASDQPGDGTGGSVTSAGDFNGDGVGDWAFGAGRYDVGDVTGDDSGRACIILSGGPQEPLCLVGETSENLGMAIHGPGDVNGDGFSDLVFVAPKTSAFTTGSGRAIILLGGSAPNLEPDATLVSEDVADGFGFTRYQ